MPTMERCCRDKDAWLLGTAETTVWACLFYSFAGLLARWEDDLGWPKVWLTGAFTASLLTSAMVAPVCGSLIDAGYARVLFAGASACGSAGLLLLSNVQEIWQFYACWMLLGASMSGCLYEPCFAYLVRRESLGGRAARPAIVHITLMAGFAGTISFPTANAIASALSWRAATRVFAGMVAVVAVPLFLAGVRDHTDTRDAHVRTTDSKNDGQTSGICSRVNTALRTPTFWYVACAYSTLQGSHMMLVNHLLPMLYEVTISLAPQQLNLSCPPTDSMYVLLQLAVDQKIGVLVISLIGPAQVLGRVCMVLLDGRFSMVQLFGAVCLAQILAAALLMTVAAGASPMLLSGTDSWRLPRTAPSGVNLLLLPHESLRRACRGQ